MQLEHFIPPRTGKYVVCTLAQNRKENNKNYGKERMLESSQYCVSLLHECERKSLLDFLSHQKIV